MFEITDLKYHQCQQFRNYLLDTGDRELIHTVSDDYWGQGRNGKGLNTHGKVLGYVVLIKALLHLLRRLQHLSLSAESR